MVKEGIVERDENLLEGPNGQQIIVSGRNPVPFPFLNSLVRQGGVVDDVLQLKR